MEKHSTISINRVNQLITLLLLLVLSLVLTEIDAVSRRRSVGSGGPDGGSSSSSSISSRRRRNKRGNMRCLESSVAEYKLTFHGQWSEERFPRMYPRRRPPAQWSKLVGRSHDPSYYMWKLGQKADAALTEFAEHGDSSLYEKQPQGYGGIFDTFHAEPISSGEGWTSTYILADGLHSRLSFLVKLVPSPDWFVGLDSLDLCRRGRWRPRAHVNLRPVDSGTQRGYTFTSPNWPSSPQEPVYQITSVFPDHPASAFLYQQYRRLPRIAFVDVERVAHYARRGPASVFKSNRTKHLYEKTTTTTPVPTTTTPATPSTTVEFRNDMDTAHLMREASYLMEQEMDENRYEVQPNMDSNPDFAAAHTSHHTQWDNRRFPATTVISAPAPATSFLNSVTPTSSHNFPIGVSAQSEEREGKVEHSQPTLGLHQLDHNPLKEAQGDVSAHANMHRDLGEGSHLSDMKTLHYGNSEAVMKQTSPYVMKAVTTPRALFSTMHMMSNEAYRPGLQLEEFHSREMNDKGEQVHGRSGDVAKYGSHGKPDPSQGKDIPSPVEPAPSQSEHTFDEPQFPQLSADDSSTNNGPVDCTVSDWSQWSSCSKTCGFGVKTRARDVLSYSRNAGLACPLLEQEVLCGSMRTCNWNHFSFLSDKKRPRRVRRPRTRQHNHHRKRSLRTRPRLRLK